MSWIIMFVFAIAQALPPLPLPGVSLHETRLVPQHRLVEGFVFPGQWHFQTCGPNFGHL